MVFISSLLLLLQFDLHTTGGAHLLARCAMQIIWYKATLYTVSINKQGVY